MVREGHLQFSWLIDQEIGRAILISEGMSSNDNWLSPPGNQSGNVADQNRLSEDSSVKNVSNSAVGRFPHSFEVEFCHSGFVRSDGCAFDTNLVLLDSLGTLDSDLVISFVSILHAQVIIVDIQIKKG